MGKFKQTYQVWATSYPLDGSNPCSSKDPGYYLLNEFDNIQEAVRQVRISASYEPIITKLVTWQETITEVTS